VSTSAAADDGGTSRRGWLAVGLALLVGVIAAVVAGAVVGTQKAYYDSVATMAIDQPRALAASGDAGIVAKLTALRSKYSGLVTTQVFAQPIADDIGLEVGLVRSRLFARTPSNSLLIQVGAHTAQRGSSQALAEAAAEALTEYVQKEQSDAGVPEDARFTITEVSPAGAAVKVSPTGKRIAASAGLAGLVGFAAVFAALSLRARDDD
jgi:capsular polysaccharide biosynthesis protein